MIKFYTRLLHITSCQIGINCVLQSINQIGGRHETQGIDACHYYFTYSEASKQRVIRSIIEEYVYTKYATKLKDAV